MWIWEPQKGVGLIFNHIDRDVIAIAKAFHVLAVSYDQWNSEQSLQLLRANGINVSCISYNRNFKMKIYQNLTDMMSYPTRPELLLYNDNRLISEMKALRKKATMRGMSLTTDKHGDVKTDDLVDSLAGAVAMASENVRPSLPLPVTCVFR
jgi:phage terminase large subunit-like protein